MTDEERQRQMDFILAQQAQIVTTQQRHDERLAEMERSFQILVQLAQSGSERMDTQQGWINQLGEAQVNLAGRMSELAEAQTHTDQRLDALIDIVQGGRDGQSPS
jgi:hypothetical protein